MSDSLSLPKDTSKTSNSSNTKHKKTKPPGIPDTDDLYVLWDYFQQVGVDKPDFFQSIMIDDKAGFDELKDLWGKTRILSGAIAIIMAFYNLYAIVSFNLGILATLENGKPTPGDGKLFLMSAPFLRQMVPDSVAGEPVHILAFMELSLVGALWVWGIVNMVYMFSADKVTKWHSTANFFFNTFPTLASMAMVRLLNYITPAVVVPQLLAAIARLKFSTGTCEFVLFIVTRLLCLFLGFDAFLYKFQLIGQRFTLFAADAICGEGCGKDDDINDLLTQTALFVLQMLGVVQLGWFTKQRIFIFIFAGEDGAMDEKEDAIKRTWEAMVCYKLAAEHGILKSMFIWLTFGDADFQKMVLDTRPDDDEVTAPSSTTQ